MMPKDAQLVVRRLAAAEGFLELGLPSRAISEINSVQDAGPFEAIAELLRGEALQQEQRFDEAIPALDRAAKLFPSPFNQRALLGLSRCYRERGDLDLAAEMEAAAQTPSLPDGGEVQVVFLPIFQVQSPAKRRPAPKG